MWGTPAFSAAFTAPDRHVLEVAIVYGFHDAPMVSWTHETAYPEGYNDLAAAGQAQFRSTLVPDPPTELAWLIYLCRLINDLHGRTAALMRLWPQQ